MRLNDVETVLRDNRVNYLLSIKPLHSNGASEIYLPRTKWDGCALLVFNGDKSNPELRKIYFADTSFEKVLHDSRERSCDDDIVYFEGIGKSADSDTVLEHFINTIS